MQARGECHVRKLIVIAALVLASATAHAGQPRGLTLAAADEPAAAAGQAKPVDGSGPSDAARSAEAAPPSDASRPTDPPKFVERPAAVGPTPSQSAVAAPAPQPTAAKPATLPTAMADKPRRKRRTWTESRIIGELHRHGIYW